MISEVGGEKRFAAAVAKRLALLGALTQGDRRATGQSNALGLSSFDFDNKFGKNALRSMIRDVWQCTSSSFDSEATGGMFVAVLKHIDEHLTEVLKEGDNWQINLAPYSEDSKSEQTYYAMMKDLLLGPCLQLATDRVAAIKDGRSVIKYMTDLKDGTEEKGVIKAKMDAEVDAAKERGLNFHVLCTIWLYEVGISERSEMKTPKKIDVPKFLNRMLGLNLKRQKLLTDHFLKYLENEVASVKRAGTYDIGIKTITGHSISVEKPRSFCFRGVDAKSPQDRVLLYKAVVDRGMESSVALELYNDAKAQESGGISGTTRRRGIQTGFYFDKRTRLDGSSLFKETGKRVFLIINQGRSRDTCVVARPNRCKYLLSKADVVKNLLHGAPQLSLVTNVQDAIGVWNKEFKLADRPISEDYQLYSQGRHKESFIFSGSVVPVLNKILVSSAPGNNIVMPAIVRVEPKSSQEDEGDEAIDGDNTTTDISSAEDADANESATNQEPAVGQKVATQMLGSNIFIRGEITECKQVDGGAGEDDAYIATFTDGIKIEMTSEEAKKAMKLFDDEVAKLVSKAKMPKVDASNTEVHTITGAATNGSTRHPVLAAGEEEDIEDVERLYEEEYDGEVPKVLVGLEFQRQTENWYSESAQAVITIPYWQFVLRNLASKLLGEDYVMTSRELCQLEKAEAAGMAPLGRKKVKPTFPKQEKSAHTLQSTDKIDGVKRRKKFTEEEDRAIKLGVERFGLGKWAKIKAYYSMSLGDRTSVQIKDRWRNLSK